jgi:hypothetical protein
VVTDSTRPEGFTVDSPEVLSVFEAELSNEENSPPPAETPKPAVEEPAQPEAESTEQDEAQEGETPAEEEQTEESEEAPAPATDKYKVKVDGKEEEVTLDELAKGYSRTADYTRKTQALAERNKALDQETQAARQERLQLAENLKLLEQAVAEVTPKEPDWEKLRVEHPDRFQQMWIEWQQGEKDRTELRSQREAAEKKVMEDMTVYRQEKIKAERELLLAAIPEWSKEDVSKAERLEMKTYAEKMNFTAETLNQVDDHRLFVLLRKAMLYDKGQAKKPDLIQRIEKVRTAKPGGENVSRRPQTDLQKALSRLAKSGSREDGTAFFMAIEE